ncbi:MAG: helix-turn-helix domain-containing protein, partial [Geminicoccaceae bacterium]
GGHQQWCPLACHHQQEEHTMEGYELTAWRKRNKLSRVALAERIGVSDSALGEYERGRRKGSGDQCSVPIYVALSCAAIELGMTGYDGQAIKVTVTGLEQ